MESEFIPYEEALNLKELGFDKMCMKMYYDKILSPTLGPGQYNHDWNIVSAPLWQQAFDWIRERHKLTSYLRRNKNFSPVSWEWVIEGGGIDGQSEAKKGWEYEDAKLSCLKKLIEIVKEKSEEG